MNSNKTKNEKQLNERIHLHQPGYFVEVFYGGKVSLRWSSLKREQNMKIKKAQLPIPLHTKLGKSICPPAQIKLLQELTIHRWLMWIVDETQKSFEKHCAKTIDEGFQQQMYFIYFCIITILSDL